MNELDLDALERLWRSTPPGTEVPVEAGLALIAELRTCRAERNSAQDDCNENADKAVEWFEKAQERLAGAKRAEAELERLRSLDHTCPWVGRNDENFALYQEQLHRAERAEAELAQYVADANDGYLGVLHRARDAEARIVAALPLIDELERVGGKNLAWRFRRALNGGDQ